jgi:hypothetical protein
MSFACPCCGFLTLGREPPGTFEICPVCYWEDDNIQFRDPEYKGGANRVSLSEARKNYKLFGAIAEAYIRDVRGPLQEEIPAISST